MYVTVDEADNYFNSTLNADSWAACENKQAALFTAHRKIDKLPFIGTKKNPSQNESFPRVIKGQIFEVPQCIKEAVCEEALTVYQFIQNSGNEVYNGAVSTNYQSVKLGDASITYGSSSGSAVSQNNNVLLSKTALLLLSGWTRTGFDIPHERFTEVY